MLSWKDGSTDPVQCVLSVIQTMFQYVTSLMNQGYQEESARQHHLALSPKDRPEKNNTALWNASSLHHTADCFYHYNTEVYLCI